MDERLIVALVALVAVATAGSALATPGVGPAPSIAGGDTAGAAADANPENDSGNDSANNGTAVGTEVSSFMAASTESTNGSVDRGLFDATYNDTTESERDDAVRNRTDQLERRLAELRAEKQRLKEREGNMSEVAYRTRMSSLVTRIHELEAAINDTERKARATGVDTAQLDRLRNATGNLSGPEIARIARNLSGVTPGPPPGAGPPDDRGPPGNDSDGGPPDDAGPPGNDTDAGPPDGNESGPPDGNESGPPDGNESGPPDGDESGASGGNGGGGGADDTDRAVEPPRVHVPARDALVAR